MPGIKVHFLLVLLIASYYHLSGQNIEAIAKMLSPELLPKLTESRIDSLLTDGHYIIPGGDTIVTEQYHVEQYGDEYLKLTFSFDPGPSGYFIIELRRFNRVNGSPIVVYTKWGGGRRVYDQHNLLVFEYEEDKLVESKTVVLPKKLSDLDYYQSNLPDSVDQTQLKAGSTSYDLNPERVNGVSYNANGSQHLEWFNDSCCAYIWNGKEFEKSK